MSVQPAKRVILPEVLALIAQHLATFNTDPIRVRSHGWVSLHPFLLVSRSWYDVFSAILFRNPHVQNGNPLSAQRLVSLLANPLNESVRYSLTTLTVSVDTAADVPPLPPPGQPDTWWLPTLTSAVVDLCPNLASVTIYSRNNETAKRLTFVGSSRRTGASSLSGAFSNSTSTSTDTDTDTALPLTLSIISLPRLSGTDFHRILLPLYAHVTHLYLFDVRVSVLATVPLPASAPPVPGFARLAHVEVVQSNIPAEFFGADRTVPKPQRGLKSIVGLHQAPEPNPPPPPPLPSSSHVPLTPSTSTPPPAPPPPPPPQSSSSGSTAARPVINATALAAAAAGVPFAPPAPPPTPPGAGAAPSRRCEFGPGFVESNHNVASLIITMGVWSTPQILRVFRRVRNLRLIGFSAGLTDKLVDAYSTLDPAPTLVPPPMNPFADPTTAAVTTGTPATEHTGPLTTFRLSHVQLTRYHWTVLSRRLRGLVAITIEGTLPKDASAGWNVGSGADGGEADEGTDPAPVGTARAERAPTGELLAARGGAAPGVLDGEPARAVRYASSAPDMGTFRSLLVRNPGLRFLRIANVGFHFEGEEGEVPPPPAQGGWTDEDMRSVAREKVRAMEDMARRVCPGVQVVEIVAV
ncbi:hypothetical protein M427DRAFT_133155 [Gonapodya prolifera JEL478]|uniref:Uncharacterized protein n=1 Tax=Gonapodya prolifera (strain JEL478) TaxID=1344416 RepID=A0A139AMQ4_GONPJ|nr:hypothetical protein M427DRAFT_133155 [Gonapodya prolifera JEL478]|eukprot:KXS18029.1 hypothetical protein M427DRAFT_133155 [Gonapodya prolifera JEL478]